MIVIKKEPGKFSQVLDIENSLESLQKHVGGYIETVTFASDACLICNEEGLIKGLPFNKKVLGIEFVGPILMVGVDGEEFTDLTAEQIGFGMKMLEGDVKHE